MVTTDMPITVSMQGNSNTASAIVRQIQLPWNVKRQLLKRDLIKSVHTNEQQNIVTSVAVYDITDNKLIYAHNADTEHFAASVNKLPVASLLLEDLRSGKVGWNQTLSWTATDQRTGAGVYDAPEAPTSATIKQLMFDMLNRSGNTAVRVLVNKALHGAPEVNERLAAYPQLTATRLIVLPGEGGRFFLGNSTAQEAGFIMRHLYNQNDAFAAYAKNALATNIFNDIGPRAEVQDKNLISVADKQGTLDDPDGNNRHDVGIIENKKDGHLLGFSFMTTSPPTADNLPTKRAEESLREMGRPMLRYQGDKASVSSTVSPYSTQDDRHNIERGRMGY